MNDVSPRLQAAVGFVAAATALAFVTLFVMLDMLQPVLEEGGGADLKPIIAAIYPIPAVTEMRLAYCSVALLPILLPLCFAGRIAAGTTLVLGAIVTLLNVQDAIGGQLLAGRPVLGLLFIIVVALPSSVGLAGAWRWWRQSKALGNPQALIQQT